MMIHVQACIYIYHVQKHVYVYSIAASCAQLATFLLPGEVDGRVAGVLQWQLHTLDVIINPGG